MTPLYQRNADSGIWERPNASPIPYLDGAESRILDLVRNARDLSVFSPELASLVSDWPTEYHFSRSRHALLRPLPLRPGDRVLELGCGCGALTRYLGECGATVHAVEGSPLRAQIAAARCRDLPNVAVHLDDLAQFSYPLSYDWVLLVGVLEYAPVYSISPDPVRDCLFNAARFLSPRADASSSPSKTNSASNISTAAPKTTSEKPFFGIRNLYSPRQPLTFGKKELAAHLSRAGLSCTHVYYPFPDYKLPETILADAALSSPPSIPATSSP